MKTLRKSYRKTYRSRSRNKRTSKNIRRKSIRQNKARKRKSIRRKSIRRKSIRRKSIRRNKARKRKYTKKKIYGGAETVQYVHNPLSPDAGGDDKTTYEKLKLLSDEIQVFNHNKGGNLLYKAIDSITHEILKDALELISSFFEEKTFNVLINIYMNFTSHLVNASIIACTQEMLKRIHESVQARSPRATTYDATVVHINKNYAELKILEGVTLDFAKACSSDPDEEMSKYYLANLNKDYDVIFQTLLAARYILFLETMDEMEEEYGNHKAELFTDAWEVVHTIEEAHKNIYKFSSIPVKVIHNLDIAETRKLFESSSQKANMSSRLLPQYVNYFRNYRSEGRWKNVLRNAWPAGLIFLRTAAATGTAVATLGGAEFQSEWNELMKEQDTYHVQRAGELLRERENERADEHTYLTQQSQSNFERDMAIYNNQEFQYNLETRHLDFGDLDQMTFTEDMNEQIRILPPPHLQYQNPDNPFRTNYPDGNPITPGGVIPEADVLKSDDPRLLSNNDENFHKMATNADMTPEQLSVKYNEMVDNKGVTGMNDLISGYARSELPEFPDTHVWSTVSVSDPNTQVAIKSNELLALDVYLRYGGPDGTPLVDDGANYVGSNRNTNIHAIQNDYLHSEDFLVQSGAETTEEITNARNEIDTHQIQPGATVGRKQINDYYGAVNRYNELVAQQTGQAPPSSLQELPLANTTAPTPAGFFLLADDLQQGSAQTLSNTYDRDQLILIAKHYNQFSDQDPINFDGKSKEDLAQELITKEHNRLTANKVNLLNYLSDPNSASAQGYLDNFTDEQIREIANQYNIPLTNDDDEKTDKSRDDLVEDIIKVDPDSLMPSPPPEPDLPDYNPPSKSLTNPFSNDTDRQNLMNDIRNYYNGRSDETAEADWARLSDEERIQRTQEHFQELSDNQLEYAALSIDGAEYNRYEDLEPAQKRTRLIEDIAKSRPINYIGVSHLVWGGCGSAFSKGLVRVAQEIDNHKRAEDVQQGSVIEQSDRSSKGKMFYRKGKGIFLGALIMGGIGGGLALSGGLGAGIAAAGAVGAGKAALVGATVGGLSTAAAQTLGGRGDGIPSRPLSDSKGKVDLDAVNKLGGGFAKINLRDLLEPTTIEELQALLYYMSQFVEIRLNLIPGSIPDASNTLDKFQKYCGYTIKLKADMDNGSLEPRDRKLAIDALNKALHDELTVDEYNDFLTRSQGGVEVQDLSELKQYIPGIKITRKMNSQRKAIIVNYIMTNTPEEDIVALTRTGIHPPVAKRWLRAYNNNVKTACQEWVKYVLCPNLPPDTTHPPLGDLKFTISRNIMKIINEFLTCVSLIRNKWYQDEVGKMVKLGRNWVTKIHDQLMGRDVNLLDQKKPEIEIGNMVLYTPPEGASDAARAKYEVSDGDWTGKVIGVVMRKDDENYIIQNAQTGVELQVAKAKVSLAPGTKPDEDHGWGSMFWRILFSNQGLSGEGNEYGEEILLWKEDTFVPLEEPNLEFKIAEPLLSERSMIASVDKDTSMIKGIQDQIDGLNEKYEKVVHVLGGGREAEPELVA